MWGGVSNISKKFLIFLNWSLYINSSFDQGVDHCIEIHFLLFITIEVFIGITNFLCKVWVEPNKQQQKYYNHILNFHTEHIKMFTYKSFHWRLWTSSVLSPTCCCWRPCARRLWWPLPYPKPHFSLSVFSLLMIVSHTGDKLYLPPHLLRFGFRALVYGLLYPSFEPYGFCCQDFGIFSTEWWGWLIRMCFANSEVVELSLQWFRLTNTLTKLLVKPNGPVSKRERRRVW